MRSLYIQACLLIVLIGAFSNAFAQRATFSFTSVGTNAQIDSAVEYVAFLWSEHLSSSEPIKVNLYYGNMTSSGPLGICMPNGEENFAGAPMTDVLYPSCLANKITSSELNSGESDMDVYINSYHNWYFGLDGNPSSSEYDFVSVLLHEVGHGLGLLSLAKVDTGYGSIGRYQGDEFFPLSSSFPLPIMVGYPAVFDTYIKNDLGQFITDTSVFGNPSIHLKDEFTGGQLYFSGPKAVLANGGDVRLHAPSAFALGTSVTHLNVSFNTSPDGMMAPFINRGQTKQEIGPITQGILEDIGWTLLPPTGVTETQPEPDAFEIFPNPSTGTFRIQSLSKSTFNELRVLDLLGRELFMLNESGKDLVNLDLRQLETGTYLVQVNINGFPYTKTLQIINH